MMVKTKDYEGEDRRKNGQWRVIMWIMGIIAIVISVSFGGWLNYVYGSIGITTSTLSIHESRIGRLEECAARNYDYLKMIDSKVDRLIAMQMKDGKNG